jgi:ferredoxin-like protein FixX
MQALGRDSKWRFKHACPACTYELEGEEGLIFRMLTCMDGNDLLK